jgi:hypothetical protein
VVFLSKICMHVKKVKIELFAIEIIISIHISSLKKVLQKCKNWQKKILILLTENQFSWIIFFCSLLSVLLDAPEIFHEDLVQTQLDYWELVLVAMVCPSNNLDFLKIFFTHKILLNQAKSWKWVKFKTLLCQVHIVSYDLGQKQFQNPRSIICLIIDKRTAKRLWWR